MAEYEYGRIKVLAQALAKTGIESEIVTRIMEGGEKILKSSSSKKKAEWMKGAIDRMDVLLDEETRHAIREGCACCLKGKRQEITKEIAAKYETLDERIAASNEAKYVFGDSVTMLDDGQILVRFAPEGLDSYRCVCIPQANGPVSITYCYCCGGHAKHHLQTALGRHLSLTVRSSALASEGKESCAFLFKIVE
jgi:hypothetical protein